MGLTARLRVCSLIHDSGTAQRLASSRLSITSKAALLDSEWTLLVASA